MIKGQLLEAWKDLKKEINHLLNKYNNLRSELKEVNFQISDQGRWWNRWNSEANIQNAKFLDIEIFGSEVNGNICLYGGDGEKKSWPIKSIADSRTKRQMKFFFNQHIYQYYRDR
jgi:hypothetical protein